MSKDLLYELRGRGLLEYGAIISGADVREILGIEFPEYGTKKQFDEVALVELGAIDYIRTHLLGEGKYLAGQGGDYRVLLPSENKRQVDLYIAQADRKLSRARKLSKNTPKLVERQLDNTEARIEMKRASRRYPPNQPRL